MDDNGFDWPAFLRRWRDEWVPSEEDAVELAEGDVTPDELRPVVSPASEAEVADAERRLGVRLPRPTGSSFWPATAGGCATTPYTSSGPLMRSAGSGIRSA
ncbi:hypothetical protein ABZ767_12840 [Streptomyces pseudogriseolus]|uniref:hypothetical protein n=1 Tax=Streptomyces pseudogriseolus TaxID=36817 RepID=UPI003483A44F